MSRPSTNHPVGGGWRVVVDHVCKTYRDRDGRAVDALADVSFTVGAEEFVALLGPSGCGKSTLLQLVAGLLAPTAGAVYFERDEARPAARMTAAAPGGDQRRVPEATVEPGLAEGHLAGQDERADHRPRERERRPTGPAAAGAPRAAMVFQEFALFPWRTVQANVEFGLEEARVPTAERRARAHRYLELTGLQGFESRYPHQLSGGMRQRVGIARALAVEPQVLLMDEPFSALDAQTRQLLQEELLGIWERTRTTILYVTHNIQEAVFMADRVVVLSRRPGRLLAEVPVALGRPRTDAMLRQPAFLEASERIWSLIRDQAREALVG